MSKPGQSKRVITKTEADDHPSEPLEKMIKSESSPDQNANVDKGEKLSLNKADAEKSANRLSGKMANAGPSKKKRAICKTEADKSPTEPLKKLGKIEMPPDQAANFDERDKPTSNKSDHEKSPKRSSGKMAKAGPSKKKRAISKTEADESPTEPLKKLVKTEAPPDQAANFDLGDKPTLNKSDHEKSPNRSSGKMAKAGPSKKKRAISKTEVGDHPTKPLKKMVKAEATPDQIANFDEGDKPTLNKSDPEKSQNRSSGIMAKAGPSKRKESTKGAITKSEADDHPTEPLKKMVKAEELPDHSANFEPILNMDVDYTYVCATCNEKHIKHEDLCIAIMDDGTSYQCLVCSKTFKAIGQAKSTATRHFRKQHRIRQVDRSFPCDQCSHFFLQNSPSSSEKTTQNWTCPGCAKKQASKGDINIAPFNDDGSWQCMVCMIIFKAKGQAKSTATRHFRKQHQQAAVISDCCPCPRCGLHFQSLPDFERHLQSVHNLQYKTLLRNEKIQC